MIDAIGQILVSLGVNIASSTIYDFIKSRLNRGSVTDAELATELHSQFPQLTIENAKIISTSAIKFLAEHGDIEIKGTNIYAKDSVWMQSAPGTKFEFKDQSSSTTESGSKIEVGQGASITGSNGAQIRQKPDGSIDFST